MKRKAGIMIKVSAFIITGVMISLILTMNPGTFSWFKNCLAQKAQMRAATTEDIIEKFEIDEKNPESIRIKKADGISNDPVVFFSVEGDIADFVSHVNPVRLGSGKEYKLPFLADISLEKYLQFLPVLDSEEDSIRGKLRIKYLNEFIDEEKEVRFTKDYLRNRFLKGLKNSMKNTEYRKERNKYIAELMIFLAETEDWPDPEWTDEEIDRLDLSDEQDSIIEAVVPGFQKCMGRFYDTIEGLMCSVNQKVEEISELSARIEQLERANDRLKEEKDELRDRLEEIDKKEKEDKSEGSSKSSKSGDDEESSKDNTDNDSTVINAIVSEKTIVNDEKDQKDRVQSEITVPEETIEQETEEKPEMQEEAKEHQQRERVEQQEQRDTCLL